MQLMKDSNMIKIIYAMNWLHTKIPIVQECTAEYAIAQIQLKISKKKLCTIFLKKVNKAKNGYYGEIEKNCFQKNVNPVLFFIIQNIYITKR